MIFCYLDYLCHIYENIYHYLNVLLELAGNLWLKVAYGNYLNGLNDVKMLLMLFSRSETNLI